MHPTNKLGVFFIQLSRNESDMYLKKSLFAALGYFQIMRWVSL